MTSASVQKKTPKKSLDSFINFFANEHERKEFKKLQSIRKAIDVSMQQYAEGKCVVFTEEKGKMILQEARRNFLLQK